MRLADLAVPAPAPSEHDWNDQGVLILPKFFHPDDLTAYVEEWKEANGYQSVVTFEGVPVLSAVEPEGWNATCPYMTNPALRALCCDGDLAEVLELLTGDQMAVNLNLTGWVSTQRDWHADTYLNEPEVGDWYAAVWIALGDIHPASGVFQYVPGSHRWPQITRDKIGEYFDLDDPQWPRHSEQLLTTLFEAEIEAREAEVISYVPKRGDLLVWHGRLLHRGSKPRYFNAYRPALIAHYSGVHHRPLMPTPIRHEAGGSYFPNETVMPVHG